MAVDIIIPADLWDGDVQGIISAWLYTDGDLVPAGAVIAEVMVEKVSHDLVTPAMGNLTILVPAEQPLDRGAIVGRVG
jgi:pyruvate/2-oxoglutarate dehydrogenase complex dihydrolipoamide acyltransferase (E2) component